MYVVDITRDKYKTDLLCAKDSIEAKRKILKYVIDYAYANNLYIEKEKLDQNLDINLFSLKTFLTYYNNVSINNDLIIQSIVTDKDHCLFLKYVDEKNDIPFFYKFKNDEIDIAKSFMKFLVNDSLIDIYQDDLDKYEKLKLALNDESNSISRSNIKSEIISLYDYDLLLNEMLNNDSSLNQLKKEYNGGIYI